MRPMAKRLVVKALTAHGCYKASERGIHEKWKCPPTCGKHNLRASARRDHRWRDRQHHP